MIKPNKILMLLTIVATALAGETEQKDLLPGISRNPILQKAIDYFLQGDYAQAKTDLQSLLQQNPGDAGLLKAIAACDDSLEVMKISEPVQAVSAANTQKSISFKMKNVRLKDILQNLADEMNARLVLEDDIQDVVSVAFDRITPEQALKKLAAENRLKIESAGNSLHVKKEAAGQSVDTGDFREFVIPLKGIDAENALNALGLLLSENGRIAVNENSNIILVYDRASVIEKIQRIMPFFDPEPRQIIVEGAILEVTKNNKTTVGVNWFGRDSSMIGSKQLWGDLDVRNFAMIPSDAATSLFTTVTFGSIGSFLEAVRANNNVEVLSSPKILVVEGHEAKIIVGKKLGYRTISTTAGQMTMENIEFLEVGTRLTVTPRILDAKNILMEIHPEVSDGSVTALGLPNVSTSEATTKVLVEDGQTLVIGGLINKKIEKNVHKIPILGSIPLLGFFFRRTVDEVQKSELIVLISPRLVGAKLDYSMQDDLLKVEKYRQAKD